LFTIILDFARNCTIWFGHDEFRADSLYERSGADQEG
jgi:hypothetical protein